MYFLENVQNHFYWKRSYLKIINIMNTVHNWTSSY